MTDLLIVSDTHLSPRAPEAAANWAAVVALAGQTDAQVVLHLGDLTMDGAHDEADLVAARGALDLLPLPWHAVPGNHDVGDNPNGAPERPGSLTDDQGRDRWLDAIGPDRWRLELDGWLVLGVNAQLFDSGLAAEAEQWAWLADQVAGCGTLSVALVLHKPVTATPGEIAAAPVQRFVPADARTRLLGLLDRCRSPLVLSGHVHQHRSATFGGRRHVWAPTTWAVLPDHAQTAVGSKVCGLLALTLPPGAAPAVRLVTPPGLRQLTIGDTAPYRYG